MTSTATAKTAPRERGAAALAPPPPLPAQTQVALERYVAAVADSLRLGGWIIDVVAGDVGDDACAQVDAPYGQRRATVTLGPLFFTQSPQDQRDTVVHELLHLVLMPSWQFVEELLDAELPARASRVAWLGYTQQSEYAVDQLAAVIAPTLALPPELPHAVTADEEGAEGGGSGQGGLQQPGLKQSDHLDVARTVAAVHELITSGS